MVRRMDRSIAVLLTIVLTVVLAVSPALAVAKPDVLKGVPHGGPKASPTVKLQLLAINDFHGQLPYYNATLGGAAVLSAYLDKFEAEGRRRWLLRRCALASATSSAQVRRYRACCRMSPPCM